MMATTIYYYKASGKIHSVLQKTAGHGGLSDELRGAGIACLCLSHADEEHYSPRWETVELSEKGSLIGVDGKKFDGGQTCSRFIRPYILKEQTPNPGLNADGRLKIAILRWVGIGDILMTLQVAVPSIRAKFSDACITYWTSRVGGRLIAGNPHIDSVKILDWKHNTSPIVEPPDEVVGYDIVINLVNRVDFLPIVTKRNRPDNFLTVANGQLTAQGYSKARRKRADVPLFFGSQSIEWIGRVLQLNHLYPPLVGCQLNSHGKMRFWPTPHWRSLAELCPDMMFLWFADEAQFAEIAIPGNVLNFSAQLNFDEYLVLWSACDVTITPDSGGMHLSGVMNQPCLALAGSTRIEHHICNYKSVTPIWGDMLPCMPCIDWQLRSDCRGDIPWCMEKIKPERIRDELLKIL